MLRIGEFSELSTISIHMLRHYDKIGLLMPEHVDTVNGYRYYDIEQLVKSNRIVALKAMGFGLEEIKELNLMNQVEITDLLQEKLISKQKEVKLIQNQIMRIKKAMQTSNEEDAYALSIIEKTIPRMWVVSLRGRIEEFSKEGLLWEKLMQECNRQGIKGFASSTAMAIIHEIDDERQEEASGSKVNENKVNENKVNENKANENKVSGIKVGRIDAEVLLSVDPGQSCSGDLSFYEIKERLVASIVYQGSYDRMGVINSFVARWLEQNQYEISGKAFSIYHNSPRENSQEETFVTELCFPITKKKY